MLFDLFFYCVTVKTIYTIFIFTYVLTEETAGAFHPCFPNLGDTVPPTCEAVRGNKITTLFSNNITNTVL